MTDPIHPCEAWRLKNLQWRCHNQIVLLAVNMNCIHPCEAVSWVKVRQRGKWGLVDINHRSTQRCSYVVRGYIFDINHRHSVVRRTYIVHGYIWCRTLWSVLNHNVESAAGGNLLVSQKATLTENIESWEERKYREGQGRRESSNGAKEAPPRWTLPPLPSPLSPTLMHPPLNIFSS